MHELSIAGELLEIIYRYAEDAGVSKVSSVNLRIGELSGIYPDSLEFAFEVLSEGKITENADLKIENADSPPVNTVSFVKTAALKKSAWKAGPSLK